MVTNITLKSLYTRYVNEYNQWARMANAHIQAELYEDHFSVKVTRKGKLIPWIKVSAKQLEDGRIKVVHYDGLLRDVKYI